MPKVIEYDVSDVEEGGGGTGVKVKPGVRVCRIERIEHRTQKRDGSPVNDLEVALNFGEEFDWVFTYIGLEKASDWKLAEFTRALGLPDKGKINLDKIAKDKPLLRCKINSGEYQGNYSPDAGRLMPAQKGDELGGSVSEASQNGTAGGNAATDADESEADMRYKEGFEPSRESDPEIGSYDDWSDEDLLAEVEDRGLTMPGGRGAKRDKAITALRAEDTEVQGAGDTGDAAAATDNEGGDDYDDWTIDDLVKEYGERGFDDEVPTFKGRNAEARQRTAIIEALREDDSSSPFEG